ncbi:replication restart helicase PriA [Paucihalobacter sp.]|uniref:replication restart helicase PriA n=1 Tax=Paucihalobacter sp. TaxID=2850405 RepID=UPI002FDF3B08
MAYFIDVILPIPLQKAFTYHITKAESDFLIPGMRVAVPFGKRKVYTAVVCSIHQNPPLIYEAKPIYQILDNHATITTKQIELFEWMAQYYVCTLGEVLRASLPSGFLIESETIIKSANKFNDLEISLTDDEFLIVEALQHQSSISIDEVVSILEKKQVLPVVNSLIEKGLVIVQEELFETYKPKLVKYVKINETYKTEAALRELLDSLTKAPKQREVVLTFFSMSARSSQAIKMETLKAEINASDSVINSLIDKEVLKVYHQKKDRVKYEGNINTEALVLEDFQQTALQEIQKSFETNSVCLVHGVTSSGKTEIYIKLIEAVIDKEQQALYLVPEIALTTQLVERLQAHFGDLVAVFHSRYSSFERMEVWNHVLQNTSKGRIIIGARSSVLLPFKNLGLVIVDEEHEQSYKQFDPAPRYHARDTAIVLAHLFTVKTLLGSATPSLESYYNARQQKYALVEINQRFNKVQMPEMELVDIKDAHKRKRMKGHFSLRLIDEINEALGNNLQVILFQNRRGYSPIVECLTCGHAPQCPNCDVSLTYHQYRNQLRCHYCGHHTAMPQQCGACGSHHLDTKGFGTEQIESEAKQLFPTAKVARMDLDTTRGKYGYQKVIGSFQDQEVDILVGTQMLTKGLDFRNVKVVGIMNADSSLNFPDFRAHERSFQLMTQVAGRAGRTDIRGKVLIQTFNPDHNILQQVSQNNYYEMFAQQMNERHNFKYPPLYRLIKITLKHKDFQKTNFAADWYATSLKQLFGDSVLGPEFPPISRIRNQYHKNILIKIGSNQSLKKTKEAIVKINNSFQSVKDFRAVKVVLNVDNY